MQTHSLLHGPILKALVRLALPIMGTAFLQMAYNMTDLIWLGHLSSNAVAAAGTAGFFMWLGLAFILVSKLGAEIGVAQSVGRSNLEAARGYARNAVLLNLTLSLVYGLGLFLWRDPLMSFFRLADPTVIRNGTDYLAIIALGMPFAFINPVLSAIYNGYGNTRTPFYINTVGLVFNILVDPLLIFGAGPLPAFGVRGAAWATILSQGIVALLFIYRFLILHEPFGSLKLRTGPDWATMRSLVGYGLPVAVQSGMFTVFAMLLARIIAQWGPLPIAVQKVGAQIEAISWMTASGFSTALGTFVGQNYGAGQWKRILKGYFAAIGMISIIGLGAGGLLIWLGGPIFSLFVPEADAVAAGAVYLRIVGYSQVFMCLEITTAGAFNGLGRTLPPAITSVILTGLRVPAALVLSQGVLGVEGVWWSVSISSVLKGIVLLTLFAGLLAQIPEAKALLRRPKAQL